MAKTFIFEIQNFAEEAEIISALGMDKRRLESPEYSLQAPNTTTVVKGKIIVASSGYNLIEFRNELSIEVTSSSPGFKCAADIVRGRIRVELRTPDGKLLDQYDDYKSLFINKTGKLSLDVHIADIRDAILEEMLATAKIYWPV